VEQGGSRAGKSYNIRIIAPSIQEAVKAESAKFTAEELITKREDVKEQIKANLTTRLLERFIMVDEFNIIDFEFSPENNISIEQQKSYDYLRLIESSLKFIPEGMNIKYDDWLSFMKQETGLNFGNIMGTYLKHQSFIVLWIVL